MGIKQNIGKLDLKISILDLEYELISLGFIILAISFNHVQKLKELELKENHRDPFDRLLIATAISENMKLVSGDEKFKQYSDILDLVY